MSTGRVESVWVSRDGSEVTVDAPTGTQVIAVDFPVDFDENGGQLAHVETGTVYDYTTVDVDAETVTLAAPLPSGVAFAAGDALEVYPPADEMYAAVRLDDADSDEEAVEARVNHPIRAMLPEGVRGEAGESVEVDDTGSEWVVVDVFGTQPVIDGAYLEPGTVPGGSDGDAPISSPTPTIRGGIGVLFVSWDGVDNADPVTYEVHLSAASGFTPSPTTLAVELRGTLTALRTLPDGTALDYDSTYYVVVVAKDEDGSAPASSETSGTMVRVNTPDVAAEFVYAGEILVDQLTAGTMNAEVTVAGTFRTSNGNVNFSDDGITIYGQDAPRIVLPSDEDTKASFRGDVEAEGLTVTGAASLRSTDNEIANGGSLTLQSSLSPPQTAPTAISDWETTVPTEITFGYGLVWDGTTWCVGRGPSDGFANARIIREGQPDVTLGNQRNVHALTRIGTDWYTAEYVGGFTQEERIWRIVRYSSTGTVLAAEDYTALRNWSSGPSPMALGTDGTNLLIAEYQSSNSRFRIQTWNASTLAFVSTAFTGSNSGFKNAAVVGVARGTFDLGAQHTIILSYGAEYFYTFNSGLGYDDNNIWETPSATLSGFAWDGARFWSTRQNQSGNADRKIFKHTQYWWDTGVNPTWYVTNTWRDTNAVGGTHETAMGPVGSFIPKKRARITLTSASIPPYPPGNDIPNATAFYLSNTTDARTSLFQQTLPADGVNMVALDDTIVFTGTNPPAASNFPQAEPAIIRNNDDSLVISGDGTIKTAPLPLFYGYAIAEQTLANETWVSIAVSVSGAGALDTHNGFTSGSYAVPLNGIYELSGSFSTNATPGSNTARAVMLTKNGTNVNTNYIPGSEMTLLSPANIGGIVGTPVVYQQLVAGDIIRLFGWHSRGSNLNTSDDGYAACSLSVRCLYLT